MAPTGMHNVHITRCNIVHCLQLMSKRNKSLKKRKRRSLKGGGDAIEEAFIPVTNVSLALEGKTSGNTVDDVEDPHKGLIDALLQNCLVDMETQICEQEIDAMNNLDSDLKEENIMVSLRIFYYLLTTMYVILIILFV